MWDKKSPHRLVTSKTVGEYKCSITCPIYNHVISFSDNVIDHRSVFPHGFKLTAMADIS
jgi:hypothetical protein